MNTIKAIQILSRRMTKASTQEREAFNYLIDYIAGNKDDQILSNERFEKLYIYLYGEFIKHYETTVFDPIPQTELNRILDQPLSLIIQKFVDTINMGEMYQDPSGKTAKWDYETTAENLRSMVVKQLG